MTSRLEEKGFADSITSEMYHRTWEEYSATDLKNVLRSPRRMAAGRAGLLVATKAMAEGTLAHSMLWEPDRFDEQYVIVPPGMTRNEKHAKYQEFLADVAEGREVLLESDVAKARELVDAVHADETWQQLHDGAEGVMERSIWWSDNETGLPCKTRPDELIELEDRYRIIDLKKTRDSTEGPFARQIHGLHYDLQAVHYCAGVTAVTGKPCEFIIVAAENKPAFEVNCYMIVAVDAITDWYTLGQQKRNEAMSKINVCRSYNRYPNANDNKVLTPAVPGYLLKDLDEPFVPEMDSDE